MDKKILNKEYFKKRDLNDDLRVKAFESERTLVKNIFHQVIY